MKDNEKLELVLERFYQRFNKFNTKVLKKIGEAIKQVGEITPSQAYQLGQELKYGVMIDDLLKELSRISGQSVLDVDKLLDNVAKENVDFAEKYYEAKNKEFTPYEDNEELQRYVNTIKTETYGTFKNIAKSTSVGFTFKDKNDNTIFKPFKKAYRDLIDEAVYNITTGVKDYQSAMRTAINAISDSGVKIHEETATYKSGYNRRIDSSARQNILEGVRKVNLGIQERIGEEIGADGVEVSHHENCSPDHYVIDGQQFKKKEFEKINNNLTRPVGMLNCYHFAFSIVLGIDEPQYTDRQLKKDIEENEKGFEFEGKHYTNYEGTQLLRKIELGLRKQKDRQIISRSSGDNENVLNAQNKISQLTRKYNEVLKASGLPSKIERARVAGYKRVSTK